MSLVSFPPPYEFGAPSRYTDWRPEQLTALFQVSNSNKTYRGVVIPTGGGKSLLAAMLIAMHGGRGLILTDTRGLQDQYGTDLLGSKFKVADLRGANNYPCPALLPGGRYHHLADSRRGTNCDAGPCRSGLPCSLRTGGCPYYDAEKRASEADIVVSNYAKWLVTDTDSDVWGTFDWLILDELHATPEAVAKSMTIDLNLDQISDLLSIGSPDPNRAPVRDWYEWGQLLQSRVSSQQVRLREELRLAKETGTVDRSDLDRVSGLQRLSQTADKIQRLRSGEWIITRPARNTVRFNVLWPRKYCNELLFRGIRNVVGMSATARPRTLNYLGLSDSEFDFFEQPSSFLLTNRPVYILPFAYVQWNMTTDSVRKWIDGIDVLIGKHGANRRVLVHTISYERQKQILGGSRHSNRMIASRYANETAKVVKYFREQSPGDSVLVGPSFSTGYNFPGQETELQIIGKLPFPDSRDPITKARSESDPSYRQYTAMQYIVQAAGRGVRAKWDRCMTVITDGHALRFFDPAEGNRKYAPKYFLDALKIVQGGGLMPKPLPKLRDDEIPEEYRTGTGTGTGTGTVTEIDEESEGQNNG